MEFKPALMLGTPLVFGVVASDAATAVASSQVATDVAFAARIALATRHDVDEPVLRIRHYDSVVVGLQRRFQQVTAARIGGNGENAMDPVDAPAKTPRATTDATASDAHA